ncbi:LacI family DNA-binding transcriptional regulator [Streptomyces sp. NPDC002795]|uniref:LacI family DNA-binding transcriptional regulator n=1 Tax=Streptomyces sp. NPDC002795 TaxID=3364665 RepID=UPI00369BA349
MSSERPVRKHGIRGMRVSAADVARAVGVSPATVSYVLNDRPGVSQDMRDRVLGTARELGYPLQAHQRDKGRERTRVIGLILQDIANPFYTEVSAGVIDAARARDYEVFLAHTQESGEMLAKVVDTMITRRVDGIVITVLHPEDGEVVRRLRGAGVPFIQFSRRIPDLRADFVGIDDFAVASDILRHVVEDHGHTDVAVITGPPNSSASSTRAAGFVSTAQAIGLSLPPHRRFNAYLTAEGGHTVVQRLMVRRDLPRAIVCGSDAIASGVIGALRSQGLRVPDDVAVTGVDGVFPAASMLAELTTISVPRRRMAELSVEQLIRRVDGVGGPPQVLTQPHRLRIGTSCGCRPDSLVSWPSAAQDG